MAYYKDILPKVSVVVPAFNEEAKIARTLNDVVNQDYTGELELIVSDNNSTDRTLEIVAGFPTVRVVHEARKGTRFNYDTGMRAATGDIIALTNADVRLPTNWISSLVAAYDSPQVVGVGTFPMFEGTAWYVNFVLKLSILLNPKKAMWGPSLSSTREAFYKVGGMDQGVSLNEDSIFSLLLEKHGQVKILHEPVVLMDGRRFQGGFLTAFSRWLRGYGFNSLKILAKYILFGRIEGAQQDFEDIRTPD